MTGMKCVLNFLHYWLCQKRLHGQLPWHEFISSCWLAREYHSCWYLKYCLLLLLSPSVFFLQPSAVAADGSSRQALTTSKHAKSHTVKQTVAAHMTLLPHIHINKNKNKIAPPDKALHYIICEHTHDIVYYITPCSPTSFALKTTPCFDNNCSPTPCTTVPETPETWNSGW